jgi:hypothetical protein
MNNGRGSQRYWEKTQMTKLRGIKASKGRSTRDIENLARSARRQLGFDSHDHISGVEFFERLHRLKLVTSGRETCLDWAVEELPPGFDAVTRYDPDRQQIEIVLSPETYDGLEEGDRRQRFCLFHELGHALLHTAELVKLAAMPHESAAALARGKGKDHKPFYDTEWQANTFAGAMLIPADALRRIEEKGLVLTPELIAERSHVSRPCAEIRLDIYRKRLQRGR